MVTTFTDYHLLLKHFHTFTQTYSCLLQPHPFYMTTNLLNEDFQTLDKELQAQIWQHRQGTTGAPPSENAGILLGQIRI